MLAAVLSHPGPADTNPLSIEEVPVPLPQPGEALLKVKACGVCRTDLHILEGELPPRLAQIVPGHQIVAEVVQSTTGGLAPGTRVGVSWMGGVDETCPFCTTGRENLCDQPVFTGYTRNGGYAEFVTAREDFLLPLPDAFGDTDAAPLLCAGIIGFRSLRVAGVRPGAKVGLFGFGASAQLAIHVLHKWNCAVYVSTRGEGHRQLARSLGATWVGEESEVPPVALDGAVTFAPSGDVVLAALRSLAKGGTVAINAIHVDRTPSFDYDSLLWGERQLRSVANMTRQDGRDFLALAGEIGLRPEVEVFPLADAGKALQAVRHDRLNRPAVIRIAV